MSTTEEMRIRVEERNHLLSRATALLRDDSRIVAVWLHGSLGRGSQDEWSDIDLWIVVADDKMDAICAERQDFGSRIGSPLLTIEAPQNAPAGGAYLLYMYAGSGGPQVLDCSWQPQSAARRPCDTILILDRVDVPMAAKPDLPPIEARLEKAVTQTRFFWMMATVVAKYIARRADWEVISLLSFLSSVIHEIERLVGRRAVQTNYRHNPGFPPPLTSSDQLAALRGLVEQMTNLVQTQPTLSKASNGELLEQVNLFISVVEQQLN